MVTSGEVKATLPAKLSDASQKKLTQLQDAKPEDFAGYYDPMQVSAHKDAVSLFERYAKSGDNSKLKDWAGKTLPTLQHHLQMAEDLEEARLELRFRSSHDIAATSDANYGIKELSNLLI